MATVKKMVSMDESCFERIDAAAKAVGENRSQFLLSAANMRIDQTLAITPAQYEAIKALLGEFDKSNG